MKITRKMIITWSVTMSAILVIACGIISLTLALMPVRYGRPMGTSINAANLFDIKYTKQSGGKQLLTDAKRPDYDEAIAEILGHLEKAGKTNKLKQLGQASGKERVTNNNNRYTTVRNFQSNHTQYLKISFRKGNPQYGIVGNNNSNYGLVSASEVAGERNSTIWIILIPLDNIKNKFTEQTWYLVRYDPMESDETSLSITQKFTTYGNYYKLAEYISELEIL